MNIKAYTFLLSLTFLFLFSGSYVVFADDLQDGLNAFAKGEFKKAFKLLQPLAEQGQARAQLILGRAHYEGIGVTKSYELAYPWFVLCSSAGNKVCVKKRRLMEKTMSALQMQKAQVYLGSMHLAGPEALKDYDKASKWFRLSAEQGNASAQFLLGRMYATGTGFTRDLLAAHMWWSICAAGGDEPCVVAKRILEKKMTLAQIKEAQTIPLHCKNPTAYLFGKKIQQTVREKSLTSIFNLVNGELNDGPRKKDALEKSFDEVFSDEWRTKILSEPPTCAPVGYRGFLLGNGQLWYDTDDVLSARGDFSIVRIYNSILITSYKPDKPSWTIKKKLLRPICFNEEWASSDNYEEYHERYGGDSKYRGFVQNIGKYIGSKVPLEPIMASWGTKVSLAEDLNQCTIPYAGTEKTISLNNNSEKRTIEIDKEGVMEKYCSLDGDCDAGYYQEDSYTVLKNLPKEVCGFLAPQLENKCVDVRVVKKPPNFRGGIPSGIIYGIVKEPTKNKLYVVPLKNFNKVNDALNFADTLGGSVFGQEEVKKEYWDNGKLKSEKHYKNGKQDGLETSWLQSGEMVSETHYKNGEKTMYCLKPWKSTNPSMFDSFLEAIKSNDVDTAYKIIKENGIYLYDGKTEIKNPEAFSANFDIIFNEEFIDTLKKYGSCFTEFGGWKDWYKWPSYPPEVKRPYPIEITFIHKDYKYFPSAITNKTISVKSLIIPSFNCAEAKSKSENTICSNPALSRLDYLLAESYKKAKRNLSGAEYESLIPNQKVFLKDRNKCESNIDCLSKRISSRTEALEKLITNEASKTNQKLTNEQLAKIVNGEWKSEKITICGISGDDWDKMGPYSIQIKLPKITIKEQKTKWECRVKQVHFSNYYKESHKNTHYGETCYDLLNYFGSITVLELEEISNQISVQDKNKNDWELIGCSNLVISSQKNGPTSLLLGGDGIDQSEGLFPFKGFSLTRKHSRR